MLRVALLVHVLSVVFWVGGMAFVRFALAPALTATLQPPQRLPLLAAILRRFLAGVTLAVVLIVLSGAAMFAAPGAPSARMAVHVMTGIGLLMVVLFAVIRIRFYPRLQRAVGASEWPAAGAAAGTIRRLVDINLVLGIVTIAVALLLP